MIISIKPWLDMQNDAAAADESLKDGGFLDDWNGVMLSSSVDMDDQNPGEPSRGVNVSPTDRDGKKLPFYHQSVMPREVLAALKPAEGMQIFDGTVGAGGHSELILQAGAHVIGCDQDAEALAYAKQRLAQYEDRFLPVQRNFGEIDGIFEEVGVDRVNGILLDVGVSSRQIDSAERGFSFAKDGPLDMRMNRDAGESAADLVNNADESELGRIFRDYGEERSWRKVARAIVEHRENSKIETTAQLSEIVGSVIPKTSGKNPATRVFQALRIAVNDELARLEEALEKAAEHLVPGGVLAVITFHSLEDRIVKQFLHGASMAYIDRPEWPEPKENPEYRFSLPHRKPVSPGQDEVDANPRSRSAKLRIGIRV